MPPYNKYDRGRHLIKSFLKFFQFSLLDSPVLRDIGVFYVENRQYRGRDVISFTRIVCPLWGAELQIL
jgi:hypothetical protein